MGILDFEECGLGPAIYDFANVCSTLLIRSGLDSLAGRMTRLVALCEEGMAAPLDKQTVQTAMLAHGLVQ